MDNTNPVKTKPRRWFRFRLRTLLVMVTLLSVPLSWVGWELDQRRREKSAIACVEEMGGIAYFHSTYPNNKKRNWWTRTKDKWLGERVLGVRISGNISGNRVSELSPLAELKYLEILVLDETKVSDLSPLAELKYLNQLDLYNTQVSDLSPLAELKYLEFLNLTLTHVSDLSPLAELKKLKHLHLINTQVSDEQVQELRLALPNCDIRY